MIKTIQRLGLAGLVALASCEKPITKVELRRYYEAVYGGSYRLTDDGYKSLWGIDLDGDDIIDEAVQVQGYNAKGWSLPGVINQIAANLPRDKWEHLLAPDFKEKSYIITDNTREMTPEERATLTSAYKLLQNLKK